MLSDGSRCLCNHIILIVSWRRLGGNMYRFLDRAKQATPLKSPNRSNIGLVWDVLISAFYSFLKQYFLPSASGRKQRCSQEEQIVLKVCFSAAEPSSAADWNEPRSRLRADELRTSQVTDLVVTTMQTFAWTTRRKVDYRTCHLRLLASRSTSQRVLCIPQSTRLLRSPRSSWGKRPAALEPMWWWGQSKRSTCILWQHRAHTRSQSDAAPLNRLLGYTYVYTCSPNVSSQTPTCMCLEMEQCHYPSGLL